MSLRILQVLILFGTTQFELGHCKSLEIESLQISIPQKFLGSDQTRCLIMIFMSLGHSFSFCSPRRITNSLNYESFENWIYSIVPETAQITCVMMTLMSLAYSASFNPVLHKSYYVPNETTNLILSKLAGKRPHQVLSNDFHVYSTFS